VIVRRSVAVFAAVLLGGCALVTRRPTVPPPLAVSAERLLASIDERAAALHTFRALAQMHYVGPKESLAVKEVVALERPDHLRIEMMSPFGVALQIASNGQRLFAYHHGEHTFYGGRASAENLARFTRFDLELAEVIDLLVGLPPARERRGGAAIAFERPQGWWKVTSGLARGGTLVVWFDPDTLLATRAHEIAADGTVRYVAQYAQYEFASGIQLPREVRFEVPAQQAKVDLRYSNVSVNTELAATLFAFDPPPASKIVDLDSLG
jgi:outer membrane lipoprotein-sorting protein